MPYLRRWWVALLSIWVTFGLINVVSATGAPAARDENQHASNTADLPAWLVLEIPIAGTLGTVFVPAGIFLLLRRLWPSNSDDS
jgi:hypothetical protein